MAEELTIERIRELRSRICRDYASFIRVKDNCSEDLAFARSAPAIVDFLLAENERLTNVLEGKLDRETLLQHLHFDESGLDVGVTPPEFVRRILAEMFAVALDGAPNFQTALLQLRGQDYEMTIRRIEGKAPGEVIGELRAKLDAQTAAIHDINLFLNVVRNRLDCLKSYGHIEESGALEILEENLNLALGMTEVALGKTKPISEVRAALSTNPRCVTCGDSIEEGEQICAKCA